jgi:hypothetical protein
MELPEHLPLADLKKAIKQFKTEQTPKLSSKKSVLMEYAARVGIVKSRETASASASQEDEAERVPIKVGKRVPLEAMVAPLMPRETRIEPKKKVEKALPEVLKKPVEAKPAKGGLKTPPEPEKPKGSPFALFMAQHKGKGLSMGQLAELYRRQK